MEDFKVYEQLKENLELAREKNGCKIYNVLFQEEKEDPKPCYRVLHIGQRESGKETRVVLLLGESGAGKTTFISAALNYLFGVEFNNPFRLQVKEESTSKMHESQTDTITAYAIYSTEGMKHQDYNYVFIDTPGLNDTRGNESQERVIKLLGEFLMSEDAGVRDIHYIGVVAKASTNRVHEHQMQLLEEVTSLLGGDVVSENTCIIATHAASVGSEPLVFHVMKDAGVEFQKTFEVDSNILNTPQVSCDNSNENPLHDVGPLMWRVMMNQYVTFFSALNVVKPLCNKVFKAYRNFENSKIILWEEIQRVANLLQWQDVTEMQYVSFDNAILKGIQTNREINISVEYLGDSIHAVNCKRCKKTCWLCDKGEAKKYNLATIRDGVADPSIGVLKPIWEEETTGSEEEGFKSDHNDNGFWKRAVGRFSVGIWSVLGAAGGVAAAPFGAPLILVMGIAAAATSISGGIGYYIYKFSSGGSCQSDHCWEWINEHFLEKIIVIRNFENSIKFLQQLCAAAIEEKTARLKIIKENISTSLEATDKQVTAVMEDLKTLLECRPTYIEKVSGLENNNPQERKKEKIIDAIREVIKQPIGETLRTKENKECKKLVMDILISYCGSEQSTVDSYVTNSYM